MYEVINKCGGESIAQEKVCLEREKANAVQVLMVGNRQFVACLLAQRLKLEDPENHRFSRLGWREMRLKQIRGLKRARRRQTISTRRWSHRNFMVLYIVFTIVIIARAEVEADGTDRQSHSGLLVGESALDLGLDSQPAASRFSSPHAHGIAAPYSEARAACRGLPIESARAPRGAIRDNDLHITTGRAASDQECAKPRTAENDGVCESLAAADPEFKVDSILVVAAEDQNGEMLFAIPPRLRRSVLYRPTRRNVYLGRFGRCFRPDIPRRAFLFNLNLFTLASELVKCRDQQYLYDPFGPESVSGLVNCPVQLPKQGIKRVRLDQRLAKVLKHSHFWHRAAKFKTTKMHSVLPSAHYCPRRAERQSAMTLWGMHLQFHKRIQRRYQRLQRMPNGQYLCQPLIDIPRTKLLRLSDLLSCKPRASRKREKRKWCSKLPTWRDLTIAPESRCSPYDRENYRYPQSIEEKIVDGIGKIYGPYTGRCFSSTLETDIEHIVATSEAHDSGLCAADLDTRRQFATDLLNLALAAPEVNQGQKSGKDAAEWLPRQNACWFAGRVVEVRRKYNLTINFAEVAALERVLTNCDSTAMIVQNCDFSADSEASEDVEAVTVSPGTNALEIWDSDGDGRIRCKEARNHGIAPVKRGDAAYKHMDDRDGDGQVCE